MEKPEESELHGILTAHAARYPLMRPADAVKLLYQQEFGGGHLVTDTADSLVRLRTERAAVKSDPSALLFEELGGGVVPGHAGGPGGSELPSGAAQPGFYSFRRAAHRGPGALSE